MKIDDIFAYFFILLWIITIIGTMIFFGYLSYIEYKDWQDTKQLIREHNGTCIDKGYSVECQYSEEPICIQNGKKINCSEIKR